MTVYWKTSRWTESHQLTFRIECEGICSRRGAVERNGRVSEKSVMHFSFVVISIEHIAVSG